ncbi:MAG: hypothetical protein JNL02_09700, partial [Saprospiraceae bacterium]|nr:hypothetical protein [Saprospiraceae bacterium]
MNALIKKFAELSIHDLPLVGGKNASLGEMFAQLNPKGIRVPDGFAVTAEAYRLFIAENKLQQPLNTLLRQLDTQTFANLEEIGAQARALIGAAKMPEAVADAIRAAYRDLLQREGGS